MMKRAADILESEKDTFARLITTAMGKTFRAVTEECKQCSQAC